MVASIATKSDAGARAETATRPVPRVEIARLEDQLERNFRGGSWHGPAVSEAMAMADATLAAHRPVPSAHTIWEIASHIAVWTDVVRQRILGQEVQGLKPEENFPRPEAASAATWSLLLDRLETAHRDLRRALRNLDDSHLENPVSGSDPTVRGLLLGLLQHNAYHAGQIALLAKAGIRSEE